MTCYDLFGPHTGVFVSERKLSRTDHVTKQVICKVSVRFPQNVPQSKCHLKETIGNVAGWLRNKTVVVYDKRCHLLKLILDANLTMSGFDSMISTENRSSLSPDTPSPPRNVASKVGGIAKQGNEQETSLNVQQVFIKLKCSA